MGTDYAGVVGIILAALSLCAIFGYIVYRLHTYSGTGERAKLEQMCHKSWHQDVERQERPRGRSLPPPNPHQSNEPAPRKLYHTRTGFGADRGFQLPPQSQGSSSAGTQRGKPPSAVTLPQPSLTHDNNRSNSRSEVVRPTQRNFSRGPFATVDETGLKEVAPAPPPKDKPSACPQDHLGEIDPYNIRESMSMVSLQTTDSKPQHVRIDDILFAPRWSPKAAGKNWI